MPYATILKACNAPQTTGRAVQPPGPGMASDAGSSSATTKGPYLTPLFQCLRASAPAYR
jgi:hypothetical protein